MEDSYNRIAKILHWAIAGLIFSEYFIGLTLNITKWKWLHIQLGIIILFLVILRIIWRVTSKYPKLDKGLSNFNRIVAKLMHELLYLLMILIPVTGVVLIVTKGTNLSILGINLPPLMAPLDHASRHQIKEFHYFLANGIIILAIIHFIAALYHHYIYKDNVLKRMLP